MEFSETKLKQIKKHIHQLALEMGFQDARISDTSTEGYFEKFKQWVAEGNHGEMSFLERNQNLREKPAELHPNTCRVISLRYDYLPQGAAFTQPLKNLALANVSRYALGRDYHKLMRKKLDKLSKKLSTEFDLKNDFDFRVFVDSAPVLETSFAEKSGLGWKGKHTLIINESAGSWFFLGEIFVNLPLPVDSPVEDKCGSCNACINLCPTNAIISPKTVDATRCISYLTIENQNEIPLELRSQMGNRIYGCDDCQLACPWNRFAQTSKEKDFQPKNGLDQASLLSLWLWSEKEFYDRLQGSPIRRIGYQNWLRNLAVAIGNGDYNEESINRLSDKKSDANSMVEEHIDWAIEQLNARKSKPVEPTRKIKKLINCVETMLPRDS